MNVEVEVVEVTAAATIQRHDKILAASQVAASVAVNPKIETALDLEVWAGNRATIKAGLKAFEDGLKEAFAKVKALEKKIRGECAPMQNQLASIVQHMDQQELAFRRAEDRRLAAEAAERDRLAKIAAEAAKQEEEMFGEDAPPAPQVMASEAPKKIVHGAGGATWVTKKPACEMADALEVAKHWPHLLKLDEAVALREFKVMQGRGQVEEPSEEGVVYCGIRFKTIKGIAGGRR